MHLVNCRAALTNNSSSVSLIGLSLLFKKTVFVCCCDLVEDGIGLMISLIYAKIQVNPFLFPSIELGMWLVSKARFK